MLRLRFMKDKSLFVDIFFRLARYYERFHTTHVKTLHRDFYSFLITGNHDSFQRSIFDSRFRVIVVRGTAYDNATAVIPTEPQCTTECIIVARWKAKYRAFRRGTVHLKSSRGGHNLLAVCAIYWRIKISGVEYLLRCMYRTRQACGYAWMGDREQREK